MSARPPAQPPSPAPAASPPRNVRPSAADARHARVSLTDRAGLRARARRVALVFAATGIGFAATTAQLVRLGLTEQSTVKASIARPLLETYARPDIVDRNGTLLATDVVMSSLYADPSRLLSARETVESLATVLDGIDTPALRRALANRDRRFVWLRRGLAPQTAQRIHDLGLPGLEFKPEPKRSYPQGRAAGHIIGHVNIDNRGTAGIERYIDDHIGLRQIVGEPDGNRPVVRLTLDVRAQFALESELHAAMQRYRARAASAIIMDAATGAVRAAASLPSADPANPVEAQHLHYLDRIKRGTYELGSIFKALTIAMALEKRTVTTATKFDVRNPIEIGRYKIIDHHRLDRPLSVEEIFVHSSNVGAGLIALEVGQPYQRAFLQKLGLLASIDTDAGPTAEPLLPATWGRAEVVTIAYGHGLAVAPLQFAAAGATLINGGYAIWPKFVEQAQQPAPQNTPGRLLSEQTSAEMRRLMRLNVTSADGTGRLADVPGYDVGGKTGTADLASGGGYDGSAVVTTFFAAFPITAPRYVVLVTLHDPKASATAQTGSIKRSASLNAAPAAARIIARTAPLLGVLPR